MNVTLFFIFLKLINYKQSSPRNKLILYLQITYQSHLYYFYFNHITQQMNNQPNHDKLNKYRQKIKQNIINNNHTTATGIIKKNQQTTERKRIFQPASTSHKNSVSPNKINPSNNAQSNQRTKRYNEVEYSSPHFKTSINLQQKFNQNAFIGRALTSLLPKSTSPLTPSNKQKSPYSYHQDQIKVLLRQNQILTINLNEKSTYIKMLQQQLKSTNQGMSRVFQTQISHITQENQLLKKSNDNQISTLINQVSKLNQELLQKQQQWQKRVNMMRKINLEEFQSAKKTWFYQENKLKSEIQIYQKKNQQHQNTIKIKQNQYKSITKVKEEQIRTLQKSIQNLQNKIIEQKVSITRHFQTKIRQIDIIHCTRIQQIQMQRLKKQNELYTMLQSRNNHISKLQQQNQVLNHDKSYIKIKSSEAKSKLQLQSKKQIQDIEQKQKKQKQKIQNVTKKEIQNNEKKFKCLLEEKEGESIVLERLIGIKNSQIQALYQELRDLRETYQKELQEKDNLIENLQNEHTKLVQSHEQQMQTLKIKLAQLNQANISSLKRLYENQISQLSSLNIDKQKIITSLNQKITNLLKSNQQSFQKNRFIQQQLKLRIQQLQVVLKQKQIILKNGNKSSSSDMQILRQNLMVQTQFYQKSNQVKNETIDRLSKIIQQKDEQINELEGKIRLLKEMNQDNIKQIRQENELFLREKDGLISQLKVEVEYHKKQLNKKMDQLKRQKEYFSNHVKEIKQKGEMDFQEWVTKIAEENNILKSQNLQLIQSLQTVKKQHQLYKSLWNQQKILMSIKESQTEFQSQLQSNFQSNNSKLISYYQNQIKQNYEPKIISLSQLIKQKQSEINDMKMNYYELEKKFQEMMESKEMLRQLDERVVELGRENSRVGGLVKMEKI